MDTSRNISIEPKKFGRNNRIWQSEFEKEISGNSIKTWVSTDAAVVLSTEGFHDEANQMKSRYHDIPCWDHSRVILSNSDAATDSDYIHAYYVNGFRLERKFIATQAPIPETMMDFLEMIWQNGCQIIVALTEIYEDKQHEIEPYWPTSLGTQIIGKYILTTTRIDSKNDYTKYFLEIENTTEKKRCSISLYHYTNWPAFGVPVNISKFLTFFMAVNADSLERYFTPPHMGPIVVHSNAGIDRTGTFCVLDICSEECFATGQMNVLETVRRIRNERRLIIMTAEQYHFIFQALEILKEWDILLKY